MPTSALILLTVAVTVVETRWYANTSVRKAENHLARNLAKRIMVDNEGDTE